MEETGHGGMPMITAQTVDRIVGFQGCGLPVLSLYAAIEPGISRREIDSRVTSLLDQADSLAKDKSAAHDERLSLRSDIEHIRQRLGEEDWTPAGIALFSCSASGLYEEVTLPRPVRDQVVVDETAFVRPLMAVLEEYHRSCVVIVDKQAASAWEFYQDELRELTQLRDQMVHAPSAVAGLDEHRVRDKAEELVKRHYRHVAQTLGELMGAGRYELLIVAGHESEVRRSLSSCPASCGTGSPGRSPSTRMARSWPRSTRAPALSWSATSGTRRTAPPPRFSTAPPRAGSPSSARRTACGRAAWQRSSGSSCRTT